MTRKRKQSGQWDKEDRIKTLDEYIKQLKDKVQAFAQQANKEKNKQEKTYDIVSLMNQIMNDAIQSFNSLESIQVQE